MMVKTCLFKTKKMSIRATGLKFGEKFKATYYKKMDVIVLIAQSKSYKMFIISLFIPYP